MTDAPPAYLFDELHSLADRVDVLHRNLDRLSHYLGVPLQVAPEDGDHADAAAAGVIDHGAPRLDLWLPSAWRGLSDVEVAARWRDLSGWVDWLIAAYRLPPRPWEKWWECPGVREEVSALRAWHRALVDLPVAELRHPPEGLDVAEDIDWHRAERTVRLEVARSHVEWHDAMWQLVGRVAGAQAELRPLLLRESEATDRTTRLRDEERASRSTNLTAWLTRQKRRRAANRRRQKAS